MFAHPLKMDLAHPCGGVVAAVLLCLFATGCGGVPASERLAAAERMNRNADRELYDSHSERRPNQRDGSATPLSARSPTLGGGSLLSRTDLKNGVRQTRCSVLRQSDEAGRSEALTLAIQKADSAISEQIWSSVSSQVTSITEGSEENRRLSIKKISKRQLSVKSFMSESGRALVVTEPGTQKCSAKKCCVTRVLPTDDAVRSVNRRLNLSLEEFRGYAQQALESNEAFKAYRSTIQQHYDAAIRQLIRRRAIDRRSAIRLSTRDEALYAKVQKKAVELKTEIRLDYAVQRHPNTATRRIVKRVAQTIMKGADLKLPIQFTVKNACRRGRTHLLVFEIGQVKQKISRFVGEHCFVSVPIELRLLNCPSGEEFAVDLMPVRYTREETSFSCDKTQERLWRRLSAKKTGGLLGRFLNSFLTQHLGL